MRGGHHGEGHGQAQQGGGQAARTTSVSKVVSGVRFFIIKVIMIKREEFSF